MKNPEGKVAQRDIIDILKIKEEEMEKIYLFADEFEKRFVGQGVSERGIEETLGIGAELLKILPR